jgi:hypothetical protein
MTKISASTHVGTNPAKQGLSWLAVATCCLFFLPLGRAHAGAYQLSFAGRITAGDGAPVAGPVDLKLRFFDATTGGLQLGPDVDASATPLSEGIFQMPIALEGAGFQAVFGGGADVFAEITDVTHGKTYPRQLFSAVPYALRVPVDGTTIGYDANGRLEVAAVDQAKVSGLAATLAAKSDTSHAHTLAGDITGAQGATVVSKIRGNTVSGTAPTINQVLQWDGSAWTPTTVGGGGTPESTTASNFGTGAEVFKAQSTYNLEFRRVNGGAGISVTQNVNDITVASTITQYADANARAATVADAINDGTLNVAPSQNAVFDGLATKVATTDVAVTPGADKIPKADGANKLAVGWLPDASATARGVVELATSGENAANVVVQGDDSRLSDARSPIGTAGGDLTGSYPNPTLTTSGVTAGTYPKVTVDAKGRVTGGTSLGAADYPSMVGATGVSAGTRGSAPQPLAGDNLNYLRGDGTWAAVTAMGSAGGDLTGSYPNPTLATSGVTPGTYPKVTVDDKGRVTGGTTTIVDADVSGSAAIVTSKLSGPVTSIASHGLGTAATLNVGVAASNVVQLDGTGKLPAVDASQLTNVPVSSLSCPTGYILVPADANFTSSSFCVMKYEAKQDPTTKKAVSTATGAPWVNVSWYEAKSACMRSGGHLVNEGEWMTIARNIEATAINDIDAAASIQLVTGHSDNGPASALATTAAAEPSLASCTLTLPLSDAGNASCALRGPGTYAGNDTDKGYYGTSNGYNTAYASGGANKSQLRTHVLSNGTVLWDFAGNVWDWTDAQCDTTSWYTTGWAEWNNSNVTDFEKYVAGPSGSLTSANGAGQYYGCSGSGNAMLRGADWDLGSNAGVFAAHLSSGPSYVLSSVGFRCAFSNPH